MPPWALIWSKTISPALRATVPNLAAPPDMKSTMAIFSSDGFCPPASGEPGMQALASRPSARTAESDIDNRLPVPIFFFSFRAARSSIDLEAVPRTYRTNHQVDPFYDRHSHKASFAGASRRVLLSASAARCVLASGQGQLARLRRPAAMRFDMPTPLSDSA